MKTTTCLLIHSGFAGNKEAGTQMIRFETGAKTPAQKAEVAFHVTNAPDGVYEVGAKQGHCYTLSAGDYVIVEPQGASCFFLCCMCGWKEITAYQFGLLEMLRCQTPDKFPKFEAERILEEMRKIPA